MSKSILTTLSLISVMALFVLSFKKNSYSLDEYVPVSNEHRINNVIMENDLEDYRSWYRITEGNPNTGDPTGFLGGRHKGEKAYREIYINKVGEAINKGTAPYKYPEGTIIVKEEYKTESAWKAQNKPSIKLMVKLKADESPETGDWGFASKLNIDKLAKGKSGKAKFCAGCHVFVAAQGDYVFINSDFLATE